MRKAEFIETLEKRLEGEVSDREIESSVRYYDKYFEEAKRNGQSEEEIAQELGSPLLIAKTIIDTSRGGTGEEQAYFREGELYETEDAIHIRTNLLGPQKKEKILEAATYPGVIVQLEYIGKDVLFD